MIIEPNCDGLSTQQQQLPAVSVESLTQVIADPCLKKIFLGLELKMPEIFKSGMVLKIF